MILVPNNCVACEPFASLSVEKQGAKGFVTAKQKTTLSSTKVIHAPMWAWGQNATQHPLMGLKPGDTIYVRGDAILNYGREIYWTGEEGSSQKFILVPFDYIKVVDSVETFPFNINYPFQPVNIPLGGQINPLVSPAKF